MQRAGVLLPAGGRPQVVRAAMQRAGVLLPAGGRPQVVRTAMQQTGGLLPALLGTPHDDGRYGNGDPSALVRPAVGVTKPFARARAVRFSALRPLRQLVVIKRVQRLA